MSPNSSPYRYFHPSNDHAQGEAPIPVGGTTAALVIIGLFALIAILCGRGGR